MTAKDREEAKKLCEKLRVIVNGENCYPFDEPEHIENLALWVAHLRAEAGQAAYNHAAVFQRRLAAAQDALIKYPGVVTKLVRGYGVDVNEKQITAWLEDQLSAVIAEGPCSECTWTEDPDGLWSTSCGRSWTFIEGGPEDNRVHYCHGCGKPVRIADEPNKEE